MSQEQPRRPVDDEQESGEGQYGGDAYLELAAAKAVADNKKSESSAQSPAAGLKLINANNVSFKETDRSGRRAIAESIAAQGTSPNSTHVDQKERKICELAKIVGQYSQRSPSSAPSTAQPLGSASTQITIGEALEATAVTAGQKPIEWSDAAAIQAAEVRATGRTNIVPGGVAAAAQSAATLNARITRDEDKTKLADILTDATSKLPADKPATRRDAEGVTGAEMRNDPFLTTHPTGVAASVAAAARLNQSNSNEGTPK